jgi:hypothetical protein
MNDTKAPTQVTTSGGVGFAGLLTLVFVVLKLTHVIDWSWVWVLAPLWISLIAGIVMFVLAIVLAAIVAAIKR